LEGPFGQHAPDDPFTPPVAHIPPFLGRKRQ
jgi:hypothetical protein